MVGGNGRNNGDGDKDRHADGRWKPGYCPNPKGGPKGPRGHSPTYFARRMMGEQVPGEEPGVTYAYYLGRQIVAETVRYLKEGDLSLLNKHHLALIREVLDRVDGKPIQHTITTEGKPPAFDLSALSNSDLTELDRIANMAAKDED